MIFLIIDIENDANEALLYQLTIRQKQLCQLCATWQAKVRVIPDTSIMPASWGPSEEELLGVISSEVVGAWREDMVSNSDDDIQEDGGVSDDDDDDDDGELLETLEATALTDAYRAHDEDSEGLDLDVDDLYILDPVEKSPRKRGRAQSSASS
jgi:hypothetical protein